MAREFKEWDGHFTKEQIEGTRKVWYANYHRRKAELNKVLGVSHEDALNQRPWFWVYLEQHRTDYTREQIADAVYTSDGHEEWQRFRVAMKGLSTEDKLAFLEARWDIYVKDNIMDTREVESIRINNYIGALRRGGQLDDKFHVRRS